jgi:hypothetical protein
VARGGWDHYPSGKGLEPRFTSVKNAKSKKIVMNFLKYKTIHYTVKKKIGFCRRLKKDFQKT